MKQLVLLLIGFLHVIQCFGQGNIDSILNEIETNNQNLVSLRQLIAAEKLLNKTGLYPENPEFGFHYLWGNPSENGIRKDISISQAFYFPGVYSQKNKISDLENNQLETRYESQRRILRLHVREILIDLYFYNSSMDEYKKRLEHAEGIANSFKRGFNAGEVNILDLNKSRLNLLNLQKRFELFQIEKSSLLMELRRLNGGNPVQTNLMVYENPILPVDFNDWMQEMVSLNPHYENLILEIEKSKRAEKLSRAESLPKFSTGYMSEGLSADKFHGLTFGLSVPLWENKNKLKYAKARLASAESRLDEKRIDFYANQKMLFDKAHILKNNTEDYREILGSLDHTGLLLNALDSGEISLIQYLMELAVYYEGVDQLLEYERELGKVFAKMIEGF